MRWQYRGLSEERKAWLFENVTDARRKYDMPVVVAPAAICNHFLGCKTADEMDER
jgi:hypothetical protein